MNGRTAKLLRRAAKLTHQPKQAINGQVVLIPLHKTERMYKRSWCGFASKRRTIERSSLHQYIDTVEKNKRLEEERAEKLRQAAQAAKKKPKKPRSRARLDPSTGKIGLS